MNSSTLLSIAYSFNFAGIAASNLHTAYYKRVQSPLRGKIICGFIDNIDATLVALKLIKGRILRHTQSDF